MDNVSNEGKIGYSSTEDFAPSDILYMLKDLPDACCIFKVLTDPFGTVKDMLFLFANEKYAQMVGKTPPELVGSTFFKTVTNRDEDWIRYSYQAAILRQSLIMRTYNSKFDKWFEFWAVPVYKKGFCAFVIHDVTVVKKNEENTALTFNTDKLIIDCATAVSSAEFGRGIRKAMRIVGQAIEADRVYVVETKEDRVVDFHEWRSGANTSDLPGKKDFEKYDIHKMWSYQLKNKNVVVVNDTATLMDGNEEMYKEILAGRISRYVVVGLKDKKDQIGYLVADNYSNELSLNIADVMETVAIFISAEMRNKALTDEMMYMGSHDSLTGLGNRYALNQALLLLSEMSTSVGVCYSDINGLKTINDENGHAAGDDMIKDTAKIFLSVFKKKCAYRIGGDEFIAIVPEVDEDIFASMVDKFKQKAKNIPISVGSKWAEDSKHINEIIKQADESMYFSKAEYYKSHERRHNT
jgi:diguanylate cyclase (GGDEF)-like protein